MLILGKVRLSKRLEVFCWVEPRSDRAPLRYRTQKTRKKQTKKIPFLLTFLKIGDDFSGRKIVTNSILNLDT